MDGVIVVDKPRGWTSHDVVNKMRRFANTKRVGHLGTLDPMGTGVLPLVIGRATRLAQFYTRNDKVYDATVRFGYATDTYDSDGTPASPEVACEIEPEQLETALAKFRGTFAQTPPPISAKKVAGTPAYKLARKKIAFELAPVEITVFSIELLEIAPPRIRLRILCSGGTYIRSIAHELGIELGCGAFLDALRREASGEFRIDQARTLTEIEALSKEGNLGEALIPAAKLLPDIPAERVDTITEGQIRQGRDFRVSPFRVRQGSKYVRAISSTGELVAIGEARLPNVYHPILVL